MVLLGQRPGTRDKNPSTVDWLRHVIAINEARPTSTPTIDGKPMPWPLFPVRAAPCPLLMPLARPMPLSEARYAWEAFQGQHGPDRFHTYGPYRGDEDVIANSLGPSRWFWDAWPDRIVHGGMCVPLSKSTVDLYSALGKPAVWAGQPGHSNLISFGYAGGTWTAEIEQAFAGGPTVTFAQWYFDEDPGTQLRFRDLYDWAGAEYHLGLAAGMNVGLASYVDTRLASHLFRVLPAAGRQTLGVPLLRDALRANPYNREVWYRLAEQAPDTTQALTLVEAARRGDPGPLFNGAGGVTAPRGAGSDAGAREQYGRTVARFTAEYAILARPAPPRKVDRRRVMTVLPVVPDEGADELGAYAEKFVETSDAEGLAYDRRLAAQGDAFGLMRMGQRYRDGEGVARGDAAARECLARAAGQGDAAAASPAWMRFDFARPRKISSLLIWNHNQAGYTERGFRKARIFGSADGVNWGPLTSPEVVELARASGAAPSEPVTVTNAAADRPVKSVLIAAEAVNGNYGGSCYGLSAVRFIVRGE